MGKTDWIVNDRENFGNTTVLLNDYHFHAPSYLGKEY